MPAHGALGATFLLARVIQSCSLIAIIGLVANFIAEIVRYDATPPSIFIGTITVTCIAVIYCIITSILFIDDILPFLAAGVIDFLLLIAVIVVAVIIGKPLSYLDCGEIGDVGGLLRRRDSNGEDGSAYTFATHLNSYLGNLSGKVDYKAWIGASKGVCVEAKSVWGLCIAMCIMFFFTAVCCACLWRAKKAAVASAKEVD